MKDIFEGLEDLGLDHIEEQKVFEDAEMFEDSDFAREKYEMMVRDILFDRKAECPVCQRTFTSRAVKSGKLRLAESDDDLRPRYNKFDPLPYDVMVCPSCGYASLARTFKYVKPHRIIEFKARVSSKYTSKDYPDIYSYDDAIERYKLALYDGIMLDVTNMEKAYLCLKIAWLYRGKSEFEGHLTKVEVSDLYEYEMTFIKEAFDGFKMAIDTEKFPQLGIDLLTTQYLLGELARRLGYLDEAFEIMAKLSISNIIGQRLKVRVKKMKEQIVEERRARKESLRNKEAEV